MSWEELIKIREKYVDLDEHGRDFDERGLDAEGNPIPKKDMFLQEMEDSLWRYKRNQGNKERQIKFIKDMLEDCQEELKRYSSE